MSWFLEVNDLSRATPWLHGTARLFAEYGVVGFAGLLVLSWWRARAVPGPRSVAAALWAPLGALLAIGANQPLGNLIAEPRPYTVFSHALVLVSRSTGYSFPSDHAVMAGAAASGLLLAHGRRSRLALWTVVAALAMACTRVYVGAHYPRDVVAGLAFGAFVSTAGYLVARPLLERLAEGMSRTPLRRLFQGRSRSAASAPAGGLL